MSTVTQPMTAEQLWQLPPDGVRRELVKGVLRTMPPAGFEHGGTVVNLTVPLGQHVKANRLGVVVGAETGFVIARDPDTVRAPDVAFVRRERIPAAGIPRAYWPGPPDLAVEVASPGDPARDVQEKAGQWLAAGTRAVWVIHPGPRTVTVHRPDAPAVTLAADDMLEGGDVVPGFRCRVGDLFVWQ